MADTGETSWGLEVVRGREIGRVFAVSLGPNVLGNALNGEPGIDLSGQEGTSPRRMAAKQARVDRTRAGLTLRDLESPGGTFVNRERMLPGQDRRLERGDVIQLGSVQLRIIAETTTPAAGPPSPIAANSAHPTTPNTTARPGALALPFALNNGSTCRTWDDFLTLSAKDWAGLRDEVLSGRLGAFLRSAGRGDLVPPSTSTKSPDERLDEWLGRLPTTRAAEPDLDVHPSVVHVRAPSGGGSVRSKIVITNTGYRLLRSTVRVEPPETAWVRLPPTFAGTTFTTAETTDLTFEVDIPEGIAQARSAALVVQSNGGTRRVEVRVELPTKPEPLPELADAEVGRQGLTPLRDVLASRGVLTRVLIAFLTLLGLRALLILGDLIADGLNLDHGTPPSLAGGAAVMAVVGGIAAARMAGRVGDSRDVAPSAFAGAFAGVLTAALTVAACRAVGPVMAGWRALEVVLLLAVGAALGMLSLFVVPRENAGGDAT